MVASVGKNDEEKMYNYLGGVRNDKRSEELDATFKQEKSNFRIVIVVDMWITGFDVPCLTYLYNDKSLKKHLLIQTISRVNRKYQGRESFRKIGLTFEEKAFYDILVALREQYNFEYGTDKEVDGVVINDKCKILAKKIKEIIDIKSSFADWLNNQNVRNQLKLDIKICLVKNGYPPQYSPEVFNKVMEQVENFEEYSESSVSHNVTPFVSADYQYEQPTSTLMVAEPPAPYGK